MEELYRTLGMLVESVSQIVDRYQTRLTQQCNYENEWYYQSRALPTPRYEYPLQEQKSELERALDKFCQNSPIPIDDPPSLDLNEVLAKFLSTEDSYCNKLVSSPLHIKEGIQSAMPIWIDNGIDLEEKEETLSMLESDQSSEDDSDDLKDSMDGGEKTLCIGEEQATYHLSENMKHLNDFGDSYYLLDIDDDLVNEGMQNLVDHDTLEKGYDEEGKEFEVIKQDPKQSLQHAFEELPQLKSENLPTQIDYTLMSENSTLPMITPSNLIEERKRKLTVILNKHKWPDDELEEYNKVETETLTNSSVGKLNTIWRKLTSSKRLKKKHLPEGENRNICKSSPSRRSGKKFPSQSFAFDPP